MILSLAAHLFRIPQLLSSPQARRLPKAAFLRIRRWPLTIADLQSKLDPSLMITDWELWACAQQVLTQHGDQAVDHVAERVAYLALAGDMDGVATWRAIADRIDQLTVEGKERPRH